MIENVNPAIGFKLLWLSDWKCLQSYSYDPFINQSIYFIYVFQSLLKACTCVNCFWYHLDDLNMCID